MSSSLAPDSLSDSQSVPRSFPDPYGSELGIITVSSQGQVTGMNPAAGALLRVRLSAYVNRPLPELLARVATEADEVHIMEAVERALVTWQVSVFELQLTGTRTSPVTVKAHVTAVRDGELGRPFVVIAMEDITVYKQVGLSGLVHDNARRYAEMLELVSQLELEKERYRQQAIHDSLTGAFNYAHFQVLMAGEVARARRYGHPLMVLMVDIDNFKAYNDTHGHLAGNWALRAVTNILQRTCRQTDGVARFGGEEFAIILPETDEAEGFNVAERLRCAVERESQAGLGFCRPITVSIGAASYPRDTDSPMEHVLREELLMKADERLYRVKAGGKNGVCILEESPSAL